MKSSQSRQPIDVLSPLCSWARGLNEHVEPSRDSSHHAYVLRATHTAKKDSQENEWMVTYSPARKMGTWAACSRLVNPGLSSDVRNHLETNKIDCDRVDPIFPLSIVDDDRCDWFGMTSSIDKASTVKQLHLVEIKWARYFS